MTDARVTEIRLPDGFKIQVRTDEDAELAFIRHSYTAVGEGICPLHRIPLSPPGDTHEAHSKHPWCERCLRWWWVDTTMQMVSWELMYDPHGLDPWAGIARW